MGVLLLLLVIRPYMSNVAWLGQGSTECTRAEVGEGCFPRAWGKLPSCPLPMPQAALWVGDSPMQWHWKLSNTILCTDGLCISEHRIQLKEKERI